MGLGIGPISEWHLDPAEKTIPVENFIFTADLGDGEVQQLSPKGLALFMAIHARLKMDRDQPFVAGETDALKHVAKLIDDSKVGTSVTVVFQAAEGEWGPEGSENEFIGSQFGPLHKTTLKLVKNPGGMAVIHLDSVSDNEFYIEGPNRLIEDALAENARLHGREPTPIISYNPIFPAKDDKNSSYSIQVDHYSCGMYACMFSQKLDKLNVNLPSIMKNGTDPNTVDNPNRKQVLYKVPLTFLRHTQSKSFRENLNYRIKRDKNKRVCSDEERDNYKSFVEKHPDARAYLKEFSAKYLGVVKAFVENCRNPEKLKKMTGNYDAANLTLERLTQINKDRNKKMARTSSRL